MRKTVIICLSFLFLCGCATPHILTHSKPDADFSKYRKLAVIRFACSEPSIGQEVSDTIALHLMKRGYDIAERSQLSAVISENAIIDSGLTDKDRSALKLQGVDLLILGSVTRYDCQQSRFIVPSAYGAIGGSTNLCHASISLKMVNIQNGEVLWAAQGSHSLKGGSMTAGKLLQKVIKAMENKMPLRKPSTY